MNVIKYISEPFFAGYLSAGYVYINSASSISWALQ